MIRSLPLARITSLLILATAPGLAVLAAPAPPPGFNVHLIQEKESGRFWRGGAPKPETVEALAKAAKARGVTVTFIDLRKPANSDDRSGKGGRLSPTAEEALAKKLGLQYQAVNALDRDLPTRLEAAHKRGDVYMHCMYGVNRTGFAVARFARATGAQVPDEGLGKRDWKQGDAFQQRIGKR